MSDEQTEQALAEDLEEFERFMGGLTDEQRCFWCEGYKQAMHRLMLKTGNDPKDNTNGNLPDHLINQRRK